MVSAVLQGLVITWVAIAAYFSATRDTQPWAIMVCFLLPLAFGIVVVVVCIMY